MSADTAWTPAQLFVSGEQGVWYDASDISSMFQDSAGSTPVTAVEQTVGRINDKSGNGNHATQSTSANRPTLRNRYNLLLATATLSTQNVTTLASGYQLRFSGAGSITLSGTATGTYNAGTHSITCTAGTLTLTVSGTVTNADLLLSIDAALPYQWVVTATNYDSSASSFPYYLAFDGSNDTMTTSSINFTATDKITSVVGVVKLTDAAFGMILEQSSNASITNGTFYVGAPSSDVYELARKGNSAAQYTSTAAFTAPHKCVLTHGIDLSASTEVTAQRVNGASSGSVGSSDSGSSNFANQPIYIGTRGGSSIPLNGRIYQIIVRGATTSSLTQVEAFVASKTGVTL